MLNVHFMAGVNSSLNCQCPGRLSDILRSHSPMLLGIYTYDKTKLTCCEETAGSRSATDFSAKKNRGRSLSKNPGGH